MDMATVDVVFSCVVAKQTQVEKISGAWQKFERRQVSLVERSGIGPDPADTTLFYKPNKLRPMPPSVAKLNGKTEIPRQLQEELAQRLFAVCRRQRRWELNKDHLELWPENFEYAEK
jgi:hypothetical protein